MAKICCDVDGTLIHHKDDTPRYEIIALLKSFEKLGCEIFIWSGGGVDYAQHWANKLGLKYPVIAKGSIKADIAIDDEEVGLGLVNLMCGAGCNG